MTTTTQVRITHANGSVEERALTLGTHRIGRDCGEIPLSDPNISVFHAELQVQPGRVIVRDLGSTNGTFEGFGNRLSTEYLLLPSHWIRLGNSSLTLVAPQPMRGGTQVMPEFRADPSAGARATPPPVAVSVPASAPPPQASVFTARGSIIKLPDHAPGILFAGGAQYPFSLQGVWRSAVAPQVNQVVDAEFNAAGHVTALTAVDAQTLAKERLNQLGNAAQEQAKQATEFAKQSARKVLGGKGLFAVGGVLALLLAVGGAYALGFGAELSKRSLAHKIDEKLAKDIGDSCWKLQNMSVTFPLRVSGLSTDEPILAGLEKGGYIELRRTAQGLFGSFGPVDINLTDKGREAKVWDAANGFCLGHREVDEVIRWTEPASANGVLATRIDYTWRLADRPSWATEALFPTVAGMGKPVDSIAVAQKASDGWQIVLP